jgi:formate dehydrogenase maturation protein FdhE
MANVDWAKVYAQLVEGSIPLCPACGSTSIESRFIGDPKTRLGFGYVWCASCKSGDVLSRVRVPPSLDLRDWDDPDAMDGVPTGLSSD